MSTKIHAVVDARGLPVRFVPTPGQGSGKTTVPVLLDGLRLARDVAAGRGYSARVLAELFEACGAKAQIPSQSNVRVRRSADLSLYRQRNLVEGFFNNLKHFRGIATRDHKLARNFLAAGATASMRLWLRYCESITYGTHVSLGTLAPGLIGRHPAVRGANSAPPKTGKIILYQ